MKNKIMLLGLVSMAVFAIAGCNKETGDTPESGVKTFASFSITVSNPATRADVNAVGEETGINNVGIYIFSSEALETAGSIDLTNQNKGKTTVATTTGPKHIYAVPNPPTTINSTVGLSQAEFEKQLLAALSTEIAASNRFLMVGSTDATLVRHSQEEATQEDNLIPISVTRAAAKVQLQYKTDTPVADNVDASVADVQYDLGQPNKQMYLVRNGFEVTPTGTKAEQRDDDGDGTYDHLVKFQATSLSFIPAVTAFDNTFAKSRYLAENVNDNPVTGNTSFVVIKLKVTPKTSSVASDGSFWVVAKSNENKGTVEYASAEGKIKYFDTQDAAQAYLTANTGALSGYAVQKFEQGVAWYRLNLRDANKTVATQKYAVLRNYYYKVNVTNIYGLGFNTPEAIIPKDPDTPLETSTFVSAEITIEDWTAVAMNEPLG